MKKDLTVLEGTSGIYIPHTMTETIKNGISNRQHRIFKTIDASTDYPKIMAKVAEELGYQGFAVTENYMNEGILSLKQYYAVCFLDDNPHAISNVLDPFWHAHILHTNRYHEFCESIEIEYMHHRPRDFSNPNEVPVIRKLYVHTHKMFHECFGCVSPLFMASYTNENQLVCTHYTQKSFVLPGDIAHERISELMELEKTLVV